MRPGVPAEIRAARRSPGREACGGLAVAGLKALDGLTRGIVTTVRGFPGSPDRALRATAMNSETAQSS